jgi:hypothetical protein
MRIYLCKFDIDAAYRRCHLSGETATECLTMQNGFLIMALRLTFGGAPCPGLWGCISETITDLSNTIINNSSWNHNSLFDKLSKMIGQKLSLEESIPLYQAKSLAVKMPDHDRGYVGMYIDDSITIAPDIDVQVTRVSYAVPLAIHSIARPLDESVSLPRKDIISMKKFIAEGRMEEKKTVLGWIINTRSLFISLPPDKHKKWVEDIDIMLSGK